MLRVLGVARPPLEAAIISGQTVRAFRSSARQAHANRCPADPAAPRMADRRFLRRRPTSDIRNHLNCGTVGALMCGGGNGATLLAFPIPLGSVTVLNEVPIAAARAALGRPNPPPCANEAVVEAKTMKITDASFTAVFDIGKLHQNSRPDRNVSLKYCRHH